MFFMGRQSDLQNSINRMSVPVFVVELDEHGEFRLIAANVAHARATGLQSETVLGKTPHMILPDDADAELVVSRYKACVHYRKPIVYSSEITYRDELKAVDTILHPVFLNSAAPTRVVGQVTVSDTVPEGRVKHPDQPALTDAQSLRIVLMEMLEHRVIRSRDLMILGTLMKACGFTPADVARLADSGDGGQDSQLGGDGLDNCAQTVQSAQPTS